MQETHPTFHLSDSDIPKRIAQSDAREPWPIGQVLLHEYVVRKILGKGGAGSVYLVERLYSKDELFAVKTLQKSLLSSTSRELMFFRELRIWIDLPLHPHLTACRFFRTIDDYLAIFSEYVDGGSLWEWIRNKQLNSLAKILDVAIQVAWGLEKAHEFGVIHQDVKPSNILMTEGGIAKLTDFGLARARYTSSLDENGNQIPYSKTVSYHGMTRAYCSPEQARKQKLTFKTDIWSFGVTLLEMFTGKVDWELGALAPRALEKYLKDGKVMGYPAMPASVAALLRRCFQPEPARRWGSMADISETLQEIYVAETGRRYFRNKPEIPVKIAKSGGRFSRRTLCGINWKDPSCWFPALEKILENSKFDLSSLIPRQEGSRRARVLVDLEVYEIIYRIFKKLISRGHIQFRNQIWELLMNKGIVHEEIKDIPGAITAYTKAIEVLEQLIYVENMQELEYELARLLKMKGLAISKSGNFQVAAEYFDKAIRLLGELAGNNAKVQYMSELAVVYVNKAIILKNLGFNKDAKRLYDKAIRIMENLVFEQRHDDLANELAKMYSNMANALGQSGQYRDAVMLHDRAIDIRENLVYSQNHREFTNALAIVYFNKAFSLDELKNYRGAEKLYDMAIELWEILSIEEDRREIAPYLALVYQKKADLISKTQAAGPAITLYNKAIHIFEDVVYRDGQSEYLSHLAKAYMSLGWTFSEFDIIENGIRYFEKAKEIWDRLVLYEKRMDLLAESAMCETFLSCLLYRKTRREGPRQSAVQAMSVLQSEFTRTGRADIRKILDWAHENLIAASH